jgi:hypothetical protein
LRFRLGGGVLDRAGTTNVMCRVAGAVAGTLDCAVKVTEKLRPAAAAGGVQRNDAVAGFPSRGWNDEPSGSPDERIATETTGAPSAVAARSTAACRPTATS